MSASRADDVFTRALSREILASEILRAKAVAATLVVLVAVVTVSHAIGHDAFSALPRGRCRGG